uniref:hypothetical protein n=1 Tax=Eubacterium cellulosolvens TaxID=29322 RepID=UPI0004854497|nr:hypothetical protein [[Eubacterium] cellulosolvens]
MVGSYHIIIQNSIVKYEFDIKRNITIIKGDSATGKTVLVDMIRDYVSNGSDSGVSLSCPTACRVIEGNTWEDQLATISNSIVFIDEGNSFVSSEHFAGHVKEGQNYYVLVTRENLKNLPYSITEIYGIKSSGKYNDLEPVYHETYRIYEEKLFDLTIGAMISPDIVITEDSNSGYDFFQAVSEDNNGSFECISAGGKSNIFNLISDAQKQSILIIADGAAFGAEIEKICSLMQSNCHLHLYLPESFEWLLLTSDIIKDLPNEQINHPEKYADSCLFFSWERFFTSVITRYTHGTPMEYSKTRLNLYYKHPTIITRILNHIKGINFHSEEE